MTPDFQFTCAALAVDAIRDPSLLRLKMKTPEGKEVWVDFHGPGIKVLQDHVNNAIKATPGLVESGQRT